MATKLFKTLRDKMTRERRARNDERASLMLNDLPKNDLQDEDLDYQPGFWFLIIILSPFLLIGSILDLFPDSCFQKKFRKKQQQQNGK